MEFPSIDMKATGKRIKQLRQQHHLKVEDVSSYMGFESPQAVYKWQRGDSLPTVDNLYALSKLFCTTMDNIIQERKEAGEKSPASVVLVYVILPLLIPLTSVPLNLTSPLKPPILYKLIKEKRKYYINES